MFSRRHTPSWNVSNVGLGNDLLPDGAQPLPDSKCCICMNVSCRIHMSKISQEILIISTCNMSFTHICSTFRHHLSGKEQVTDSLWLIIFCELVCVVHNHALSYCVNSTKITWIRIYHSVYWCDSLCRIFNQTKMTAITNVLSPTPRGLQMYQKLLPFPSKCGVRIPY